MKITKLLVLGALMLMGSSVAMAEIVDGVRQQPKPKTVGFQAEEEYYLYNVDATQFFTQGNAWGTQASTSMASGLKVKFTKYTLEGADWDGKTYLFNDYRSNAWFYVFFDSETGMYVDLNAQTDKNTGWEVEENGGGTFRLSASETVPTKIPNKSQEFTGGLTKQEGKYVGLDLSKDPSNTALHPFLAPGEGVCLNWAFVAVEEYEALASQLELYAASIPLKEVLDKAKAIGANVAAQEAVYLNESSTVAQLNKAVEDVKTAITEREKQLAQEGMKNATAEKPVDVTILYVKNPDFANNDVKTGWSGTELGANGGKNNAEHYAKNYDTYQTIKDLPVGVYAVGVNAFYRAGNAEPAYSNYKAANADSRNAKLYAATTTDTLMASIVSPFVGAPTAKVGVGSESDVTDGDVTYWIPNNMEAAEYYMHGLGLYANSVFNVVEDGTLTIGVRKDVTISGDWTIFDDFSLTYYGNGADAYQMWFDAALPELDIYTGVELTENHTAKYVEDYATTFAKLNGLKVSNREEVTAAIQEAKDAADAITLNVALWKQLEAIVERAKNLNANSEYDPSYTDELYDWADLEAEDLFKELALTNEELQDLIDEKNAQIEEAIRHPYPGTEVTEQYLKNPNFTGNADGWTITKADGGDVHWGSDAFEAWNNASFDVYQIVEGAPKGIYEISVQGFYRYGRGKYEEYKKQEVDEVKPGKAPVYIYMNDNQTSFTNIYGDPNQSEITEGVYTNTQWPCEVVEDEGVTLYFPNGMPDAAVAFERGMYTQSAFGVVANEGDVLRLGVKGSSNQLGDSWVIWDNFRLTYQGFDNIEVVKPILEKTLPISKELLETKMSANAEAKLKEAVANAEAALAEADGVKMFDALSALLTANTKANESSAIYKLLETAMEDLAAAISVSNASDQTYNEANNLYNKVGGVYDGDALELDEAEELVEEIQIMIKKLAIPSGENASDANSIDFTSVIVNPEYEGNNNGWTTKDDDDKDTSTGNGSNVGEVYNKNFDHYQVLEYLPAGTYTATLQGFYRYGFTQNTKNAQGEYVAGDYESYQENPEANNYLTLYALVGEDEYAAAMPRLAAGAEQYTATVEEGVFSAGAGMRWAVADSVLVYSADSTTVTGPRVPDNLATAAALFASENGQNMVASITFKIGEEGKVRIGLKKQEEKNTEGSWCAMNKWTLTYYGPNSNKPLTETGIKDAADNNNATVVKTEIFSVNGARVTGAAKGILIVKETLSNGMVKVKKIAVK